MAQTSLKWVMKDERITSVLIGASKSERILDNVCALDGDYFDEQELKIIDQIAFVE